ncbi:MANSC domain-containing protein 4 [Guaruba guarouba]
MVLLVAIAEVLLVLGLAVESDSLCSPTTFYKNCWIRRFPGLLIDLQESQKRGAQVLKIYEEVSPQQCSRTCCLLRNVSCNLAVFYHGALHKNTNCLHISCPALESCILKAKINVILYNITTGIDPDLLIFEKLTSKELHFSPSKYERQNTTKTTEWERCQHHNATSSSQLLQTPSSTTSHGFIANTYTFSTSLTVQNTEVTTYSSAETFPPDDHFAKRTSTSVSTMSITSSDKPVHSTLISRSAEVLSYMPPSRLNSSKQHLNETKGYSGRNYTSDNEAPAWEAAALGVWLVPIILCSSLIFLCCCTVAFTARCCSNRRGQYKPIRRRRTMSRQFIKYTTGNL